MYTYDNMTRGGYEEHYVPGMTLRAYLMVHAPAQEIEAMAPSAVAACAEYIGMPESEYKGRLHYKYVLMKTRSIWVDALIEELAK